MAINAIMQTVLKILSSKEKFTGSPIIALPVSLCLNENTEFLLSVIKRKARI